MPQDKWSDQRLTQEYTGRVSQGGVTQVELLVGAINDFSLVDGKLSVKVGKEQRGAVQVTISSSVQLDRAFFNPQGPFWSTVRAVDTFGNMAKRPVTPDEAAVLFKAEEVDLNPESLLLNSSYPSFDSKRFDPAGFMNQLSRQIILEESSPSAT